MRLLLVLVGALLAGSQAKPAKQCKSKSPERGRPDRRKLPSRHVLSTRMGRARRSFCAKEATTSLACRATQE